jgi:RNA polymerase sigma-70 factor (ECF subfamily)
MNEKDFDSTARRYYQPIYNYCCVRVRDGDAAYDCTQEVFLAMYRQIGSLDKEWVRAWLYRCAKNVTLDYLRRQRRFVPDGEERLGSVQTEDAYDTDRPFVELFGEEELELLNERYSEGYSIAEVAEKRGVSANSLYKRFSRMKEKLTRFLKEGGGNDAE